MPDFDKLFSATKENFILYKGKTLVGCDLLFFEDGDRFVIKIEKTNSEWIQGVGLFLFGIIEIEDLGKKAKDRTVFMENTAPKEISIKLWRDRTNRKQPKRLPKKGILGIKNVWEIKSLTEHPCVHSWHHGAAMIVEEIENGRRYRCNDGHPDDNFDDIVFTIQKVS